MSVYNFKTIQVVPSGKEMVDICLTRTQRKTPTVVHPGYAISRIRKFYMRKVKYTQSTIHDKLSQILTDFPILEQVHPFYSDLMNVLYDKDHYKLALGQLNTARNLIDHIAKDYVRLLKFGDSLYRCKQLKRAALGRMMKILTKNHTSLVYLEEVRQHLARLPSIDPNTRTIVVCGYPNVGKSSFMNKITRAEVDVQPYAFTTKSLFVGHMDYRHLRWQVLDTPGILDHPLEERNTIEMQSVTALAHLRASILFFIDISEQCGYSIEQQCSLFKSLKPLFINKPIIVVMTKIDLIDPNKMSPENQKLISEISSDDKILLLTMSTVSEEGVSSVKKAACEALLEQRATLKLKSSRMGEIANRMHLAVPVPRDDIERPANIPETVSMESKAVFEERQREWEEQEELYYMMDPDFVGIKHQKRYLLENDDWKFDKIPEVMDGKNIMDFYDPQLLTKLEQIEREELVRLRKLEDDRVERELLESQFELTDEQKDKLRRIRTRRGELILASRKKKSIIAGNIARTADGVHKRSFGDLSEHLTGLGLAGDDVADAVRARSSSRSQSRPSRSVSTSRVGRKRTREEIERSMTPAPGEGYRNVKHKMEAQKLARRGQKELARDGRRSEADRHVYDFMPKHLFSGKSSMGSRDYR
eukprot:TRINITY_DN16637_c0_g1_i1.p1 TRINITY_DN16637_c0_g1~~TRINITY_DN16637_c0_g1_i1.p1  ORF type:complete len:664 (+),score=148.74 TRINITY_DN16637_c0_g1_i1:56-1993(+)